MANAALNTIKVNDLQWSGRAEAALKNGGLMEKTLADLESMKDDELLSVSRLGRGSLGEIRQKTVQQAAKLREDKLKQDIERSKQRNGNRAGEATTVAATTASEPTTATAPVSVATEQQPVKTARNNNDRVNDRDAVIEFAKSHPSIITAVMNGEMLLIPKL